MFIAELKPVTGRGALAKFKHAIGYKTGLPADGSYDECIQEVDELWDEVETIACDKVSSVTFCLNPNGEVIYIVYTKGKKRMFVCSSENVQLKSALAEYETM